DAGIAGGERRRDLFGRVGRGVVRDDDLDVLVRLLKETLERLSQVPRAVADRNPDAHPRSMLPHVHGRPRVVAESARVVRRHMIDSHSDGMSTGQHRPGGAISGADGNALFKRISIACARCSHRTAAQVILGGVRAPRALACGVRVHELPASSLSPEVYVVQFTGSPGFSAIPPRPRAGTPRPARAGPMPRTARPGGARRGACCRCPGRTRRGTARGCRAAAARPPRTAPRPRGPRRTTPCPAGPARGPPAARTPPSAG